MRRDRSESRGSGRPDPTRRRPGRAAALAAACALSCAAGFATAATDPGAAPVVAALSPVTAEDVLARVRAARGAVVLVNVWATWCAPCREEFPGLLRLEREMGDRGLRLILVSADLASRRNEAEAFLREQGVTLPTFVKSQPDDAFIEGLESRWSGALPATLVFDRRGRKVAFWEGGVSYAEIRARVMNLLAEPWPGREPS